MNWESMILAGFAGYSVAITISQLDGPMNIFLHIRTWMGAYDRDQNGRLSWKGVFIQCPYCLATWFILIFLAWAQFPHYSPLFILEWLAAMGGAFALLELNN